MARKSISVSEDDYETISRAAYWEGFRGPKDFVKHVVMRYIAAREAERGSRYISKGAQADDDDEDEAEE